MMSNLDPLSRVLTASRAAGHLGPAPLEQHLAHSTAFTKTRQWADHDHWCDLGSGGGVPGLAIAVMLPNLRGMLLDARSKRIDFLRWAVDELNIADRIRVVEARAEEFAHGRADEPFAPCSVVLSRSFGSPATTAECAAPLLVDGGVIIVSDPPEGAARWPATIPELSLDHAALKVDGFNFSLLTRVGPCGPQFPRRPGPMAKKPLF